jgi:hypothetical protein
MMSNSGANAMIDFTKPVTTRDGRPVRILCTDGPSSDFPVIGIVDGWRSKINCWKINGRFLPGEETAQDLIQAKTKREGWVNIYPDRSTSSFVYEFQADALAKRSSLGATIKIEWEE